jgi:hypothetical protein
VAALVIVGLFLYFIGNQKTSYNWNKNYQWNSVEPYGLKLLKELLDDAFTETTIMNQSLTEYRDSSNQVVNYLFVGGYYSADSIEIDEVLTAVNEGGCAYIIAEKFNSAFLDTLLSTYREFYACNYVRKVVNLERSTFAQINLTEDPLNQPLNINYRVYDENFPQGWDVFNEKALECQTIYSISTVGTLNDQPNAIRIQLGKGQITLHTTPLQFTNYHLRNKRDFKYARRFFKNTLDGPLLIEPRSNLGNSPIGPKSSQPSTERQNPIRFLFHVPALKAAWTVMILSILAYLVFAIKRKQRRVPIIERPENYSLSFSKTISRLFYKSQDHHQVALYKMRHFHQFVHQRYGITPGNHDEEYFRKVKVNSGVEPKVIEKIRGYDQLLLNRSELSSEAFMELVNYVNSFYGTCK